MVWSYEGIVCTTTMSFTLMNCEYKSYLIPQAPMPGGVRKVKLVIASFSVGLIPSLIPLNAWSVCQSTLKISYKGSHHIKFRNDKLFSSVTKVIFKSFNNIILSRDLLTINIGFHNLSFFYILGLIQDY